MRVDGNNTPFSGSKKNDGSLRIVSNETNIIKGVEISHPRVNKMVVLKRNYIHNDIPPAPVSGGLMVGGYQFEDCFCKVVEREF